MMSQGYTRLKRIVVDRNAINPTFLANLWNSGDTTVLCTLSIDKHGWTQRGILSSTIYFPFIQMQVKLYNTQTLGTIAEGILSNSASFKEWLPDNIFKELTNRMITECITKLLMDYDNSQHTTPTQSTSPVSPTPPAPAPPKPDSSVVATVPPSSFSSLLIRSNLTRATVVIDGDSIPITSSHGVFYVPNVPPSRRPIEVSSDGYVSFSDTVLIENARITPLTVNLQLAEQTPPEITNLSLATPPDARGVQPINEGTVIVSGTVRDPSGIYMVAVNGISVTDTSMVAGGDALQFRKEVQLVAGKNTIRVQAVDGNGFIGEKILEIEGEAPPEAHVKRWAICIGINNYPTRPLRYASNDAYGVSRVLQSKGGYAVSTFTDVDVGDNNRKRSFDDPSLPTKKNIVNKLWSMVQNARDPNYTGFNKISSNDVVLFSFSGHGIKDKDENTYLLPLDWDPGDPFKSAIADTAIINWLNNLGVRKSLVMLDACRVYESTERTAQSEFTDLDDPRFERADVLWFIYSTRKGEKSYEDPSMGYGVFSKYAIDGLDGQADSDRNGVVTLSELNEFVYNKVVEWAGSKGFEQRPYYKPIGEGSGNIRLTQIR